MHKAVAGGNKFGGWFVYLESGLGVDRRKMRGNEGAVGAETRAKSAKMTAVWQDMKYAARTLAKTPGFAIVAVITLALGIGASTAIFSVIENVLMEPFPYPDAQRLVSVGIHDQDRAERGARFGFTDAEYVLYAQQNHVFDRVIANDQTDVLYRTGEGTERFLGCTVIPGTFEFLGMPALVGRVMNEEDYKRGAPPVFVMRYKTWVTRFNSDAALVNTNFVLNGVSRTLVGVMPPRFGWGGADMWIPDMPKAGATQANLFPRHWFMLGHMKKGVTLREVESDFTVLAQQIAKQFPEEYPKRFTAEAMTLTELVVGQFRTMLFIVLAAVGLLLLIGCGNVANLLLARATTREKEFAIRATLGASRWRLVRQLLVESGMLAVGGAALGALLAWGGLKGLVALIPPEIIPSEAVIHLNGRVLLFTLGVSMLTAILFGLLPALQASKRDVNDSLRDSSKGSGTGSGHARLRNAVIVAEVALSLTLLAGAGLLMRSFVALQEVHLGLQPDHILVARLPLPPRYKTADQLTSFYRPLLAKLKSLPGIVEATETSTLPPFGGIRSEIEISGKTHADKWNSLFQLVSEGYFGVLKLQLKDGRTFTESEVSSARKLAVVNETFVRKFLGTDNPMGQRVKIPMLETFPDKVTDPWFEVIGVVADAKNQGLQEVPMPEMWIPYSVTGSGERGVLVRTVNEPLLMLNAVQHEIWATDGNVALTFTGTLENFIKQFSYAGPRFGFVLMSIFASVGLVLVTIGVYSVIAYTTARRTQEIGIRMALGAEGRDVLKMVIRMGLKLVVIGVIVGLAASLGIARLIASQLWGVSAYDPATFSMVAVLLLVTGVLACWLPALRATRIQPIVALRHE